MRTLLAIVILAAFGWSGWWYAQATARDRALTGWLATVADYNPVTYLLAGLRTLVSSGWVLADLLPAIGAVALVGAVSFYLAFGALNSRVRSS